MKFAICLLILFHGSQSAVPGPVVQISDGELQGIIEDSIIGKQYVAFKGIPYGKPPVGQLRFQDPIPAEPWMNRLNASEFGPICAQQHAVTTGLDGSDDCLYVNVYTPSDFNPTGSPLKPVMFWIYGGSYKQGSGDDQLYGPDYLVDKDVIVVTMNYRVGAFGFLNVDDEAATGNQGLKDQVLALKWVQKNIRHFGGDPNSVTIFGESAGAASVHYLTLSPMANGLFHKAIAQSGVASNPWAHTAGSGKKYAKALAAVLGKEIDDPKDLVEFLRSVDAIKLVEAELEMTAKMPFPGLFNFVPAPDPKSKNPFFPKPVKSAILSGVKVPFLLGSVSHEGMLFLHGVDNLKLKSFDSDFDKVLSPGALNLIRDKRITPADLREMYFAGQPISQNTSLNYMQLQSDVQFISGIHDVAAIQAARNEAPTYLYEFSYDSGLSYIKLFKGVTLPGVGHGDDLFYVFFPKLMQELGLATPAPGSKQQLVIDRVTQMWTNFAKTGNPTPATTSLLPVTWKPITSAEKLDYLKINEDLEMGTVTNVNKRFFEKSKCQFLRIFCNL